MWIIGGRMRPGETVGQSIRRLLSRELHFILPSDQHVLDLRVRTVGHYTYCFDMRNEPPQHHGNADLAAILAIHVTQDEFTALTYFDEAEYSAICWVHPIDILLDSFGTAVPTVAQQGGDRGGIEETQAQPSSSDSGSGMHIQFHPALKRASRDMLAMQVWDKLERAHAANDTAEIHSLLGTFMTLKSPTPLSSDYLLQYAR